MALPSVSTEWASSFVNLPNTSLPNRSATTTTQKSQGFDYGQIPAVEEENYWRNAVHQWIEYIINEGLVERAPMGSIKMYALTTTPNGWLNCSGDVLLGDTPYTELRTALIDDGFPYGDDGSGNPLLPDFRGYSPRGWDDGAGVDTGRVFGSKQDDQNQAHDHLASSSSEGGHSHTGTVDAAGSHSHTATTSSNGSHSHFVLSDVDGAGSGTYINKASTGGFDEAYALQFNSATAPTLGTTTTEGSHTHTLTTTTQVDHTHTFTTGSQANHEHTITVSSSGGSETRVKNIAVKFIIKY